MDGKRLREVDPGVNEEQEGEAVEDEEEEEEEEGRGQQKKRLFMPTLRVKPTGP